MEFAKAFLFVVGVGLPVTVAFEHWVERVRRVRKLRVPHFVREQQAPPSVARSNPKLAKLIEKNRARHPYALVRRG